jgi:hypothetical protein
VALADLERLLPDETVYPAGVVLPIRPRLKGRSFFPGGCGLAHGGNQAYPQRPIMVVGQDFDSAEDWLRLDDHAMQRAEERSPTWRGLVTLGEEGLLDLTRAYFTNALLGARLTKSNTGRSPGWMCERYVRASIECLAGQIALLQPTVVVALGVEPTVLLAQMFGLVPTGWVTVSPEWSCIDQRRLQLVPQVVYRGLSFMFASCVHPSYQHLNARFRFWSHGGNELRGKPAHRAIWGEIRQRDEAAHKA